MDKQGDAFKELSAAELSDALDRLGLHGACLDEVRQKYKYHQL
ncbi:MAG: hypothetical protein V3U06_12360 [Candidatus Binatia bacterium]